MIITFVIDYLVLKNGTSVAAYNFAEGLKKRGHTVRIVAVNVEGNDMYSLKERYIPIASDICKKQAMLFAHPDLNILKTAFQGADIIHFFLPFKLAIEGQKLAKMMKIPHIAAFHCQPENVMHSMGFGSNRILSSFLYKFFNNRFYKYFDHIHCPSQFIASQLKRNGYKAQLHVFSNGVSERFIPATKTREEDGFFNILMIGRMVSEKCQDVLIKAILHSKYKDKIRLTLAGMGPKIDYYKKLSKRLPNKAVIGYVDYFKNQETIQQSDLYVHTAKVEIEGIACIEAMACSKVIIVSNSSVSAAPQFAIDERSLFRAGDYIELAAKIDYWIEHKEEREEMGKKYYEESKQYKLENSISETIKMYEIAIRDSHNRLNG